jgi:hypothetical protein
MPFLAAPRCYVTPARSGVVILPYFHVRDLRLKKPTPCGAGPLGGNREVKLGKSVCR